MQSGKIDPNGLILDFAVLHPGYACCHALLQQLEGFDIHQIGARPPVPGNENGLLVPLDVREKFGRLAFEGRDGFGTRGRHFQG